MTTVRFVTTKANRMELSCMLAPVVRDLKRRKVTTLDAEGKPVREVTTVDVAESVFARARIETALTEATRALYCRTEGCGKKLCVRVKGSTGLCRACSCRESGRKGAAALTPEQRSEISRKGNAAISPEQRRESGRKGAAALTPEQRSERARKINAVLSPEQRRERSRKMWATRRVKAAAAQMARDVQ